MARMIVAIAIVAAAAFAWHKGWIQEWTGSAVDTGIDSVKRTQRDATKSREADPGAPQDKK